MRESYYAERRGSVAAVIRDVLVLLSDVDAEQAAAMPAEQRQHAQAALDRLTESYGYCRACARSCLGELLRARYAG